MRRNGHIGPMASTINLNKTTIALLSAAGDNVGPADQSAAILGPNASLGTLLEYQVTTLARAGIRRFLVEVENVDGALLALADRCRERAQTVEFVRSGADIQRFVQTGDRILVQSGALYVQYALLDALLKVPENFIATLDGRDENGAFERIDLNTRWAGISVVGPDTIAALRDLPADWSIISSLLRHAVQTGITQKPLPQKHVNEGSLTVIRGAQDFAALNRQIMVKRISNLNGLVERRIFGPISALLAPVIWQNPILIKIIGYAPPLLAGVAAALGLSGFAGAAIASGLAALAFRNLDLAISQEGEDSDWTQSLSILTWVLFIVAVFGSAYLDTSYTNDGVFAAFAVTTLSFISLRTALPAWAEALLQSPALITTLALIGTILAGFTFALQWIMVAQLGILVFVAWKEGADEAKKEASLKRR
jgi:hypothetical protein